MACILRSFSSIAFWCSSCSYLILFLKPWEMISLMNHTEILCAISFLEFIMTILIPFTDMNSSWSLVSYGGLHRPSVKPTVISEPDFFSSGESFVVASHKFLIPMKSQTSICLNHDCLWQSNRTLVDSACTVLNKVSCEFLFYLLS